MSLIQVKNLSFTYEDSFDPVFENVSFQIDTDWKLGFIGRNGKGKTTFLKLLTGEYEYSGSILSSVDFEYFPYQVENKEQLTYEIAGSVNPAMEHWELLRELNLLDADTEILYRPFCSLSFGEQSKVLLASLFLKEHAFLLIQERVYSGLPRPGFPRPLHRSCSRSQPQIHRSTERELFVMV